MEQPRMIKRQRTLTDEDLELIAEALHVQSACNMGLTPDEVTSLKRFLGAFNKAAGIIGTLVLTAIVAGTIAIFTRGFWSALITGIKNAK